MRRRLFLCAALLIGCVVWAFSAMAADKKDAATQIADLSKEAEKALVLTPEQKEKIKVVREEFKAKQEGLYKNLKVKRDALKNVLDSDKPERSKADALVADLGMLQNKVLENRVEQAFKARLILTPEQFKKLKDLREQKKSGECKDCAKSKKKAKRRK